LHFGCPRSYHITSRISSTLRIPEPVVLQLIFYSYCLLSYSFAPVKFIMSTFGYVPFPSTTSLPTTFTPASSCLGSNNIWNIILTTFCPIPQECPEYLMQGPPSTSGCLPPGYGENVIYYPGICPSGYTTACTSIQTVLETSSTSVLDFGAFYTVMTAQICCPTRFVFSLPFVFRNHIYPLVNTASFVCNPKPGFDYQSSLGCFSPFTKPETIPVIVSATGATMRGTITQSSGGVNAYTIQVAVQISNSGTHSSTKANFPGMLS
jgi:hypothetical protein